jgi:hypothetical protein
VSPRSTLGGEDNEALNLLDQVTQNPNGKHIHAVDNIHTLKRPTGTSKAYSLDKLKRVKPELYVGSVFYL